MRWFVPAALAVDFVGMALVGAIVSLVKAVYKRPHNTFFLDSALMGVVAMDYVITTVALLSIGVALGRTAQRSPLRYKDDGLRGIRALGTMMLSVSFVVIAIPFYKVF